MRGVLLFTLAAIVAVGAGWWVAHLPGQVSVEVGRTTFEASTPVTILLALLGFAILYGLIRALALLAVLPRRLRRRRAERRRRRGDRAVTHALVALAAGDAGAARGEAGLGRRLLGDTPLTLLLAASAARQAGNEAEAAALFRELAERPEARLLGLRGLLRQAIAAEDWAQAARLAEQAEAAHPGAAWLRDERRRMALRAGDWEAALRLTGPARGRGAEPGVRAALNVAAAEAASDPEAARRHARDAFEADPTLAPAALAYAAALRGQGKEKAALTVLRRAWSARPHPDIADAYLAPTIDGLARLEAARTLAAARPDDPESGLLLARAAMQAGLATEARRHLEAAVAHGAAGRRVQVLRADIAELEADPAAADEALRQIPLQRPDPAWRCEACGTVHRAWHPVCSACGTPGRIVWSELDAHPVLAPRLAPPAAIEGLG